MEKKPAYGCNASYSRLFSNLISLELLIAGMTATLMAARQNLTTTLVISLLVAFTGGIFLALSALWKRNPGLADAVAGIFQSRYGQIVPFSLLLVLIAFLFKFEPNAHALLILSPLMMCLWLIGIEVLIFFPAILGDTLNLLKTKNPKKTLAVIGLLFAYGIALIPARISAILDGIPWDTPFEFIFVTLLLPLTFLVGGRFLSNRIVLWVLGVLLILKITLMISIPQSGLGVRTYSSEDALRRGNWERGYGTLINPSYTEVTQLPYLGLREFPIEWINTPGFDEDGFWTTLEISGAGHLKENERLAILVRGAKQARVEIVDSLNEKTVNAVLVEDIEELDQGLYQKIPQSNDFMLRGTLTFKRFGQYQIEPVILLPDGTVNSAFAVARIWISDEQRNSAPVQSTAFQNLLNLTGFALAGVIVIGLLLGLLDLRRAGYVSAIDLYLTLTALPVFYIAGQMQKPDMNNLIFSVTSVLAGAKFAGLIGPSHRISWTDILFSVGPSFLLIFLALDIDNLRKVTIFPQGQDGLEYQILARNIFVNRDFLLVHTPPRAYKVLFPYLAGSLHVLFGQSSSAQLFLSAWFALLSSFIITNVMKYYRVAPLITYITSVLFPLILCMPSSYIFYFRFGLIEPAAIFFLLSTVYFAIHRQYSLMFITGMLTVLFRLDYLGAAFAAVLLTASPITGNLSTAWRQLTEWFKARWKLLAVHALALCLPPLLITLGYFFFTPDYILNMSDTYQQSIASILEGIFRVIAGGSFEDLRTKFSQNPIDVLLLVIPLVMGFLTAIAALGYRKGLFRQIDLRWALLTIGLLPAYLIVRPTGYAPRFSLPLLAFDLVILGLMFQAFSQKNKPAFDYRQESF